MGHDYDFGGEKVRLTSRTNEHREMFIALQSLGPMGAKIARYINELKKKAAGPPDPEAERQQLEAHQRQFPMATPGAIRSSAHRDFVPSEAHTPGPWQMARSGMVRAGNDWICAVTARNRIFNGSVITAAPDMLAMLERMLGNAGPQEARRIIADARVLVERAKAPGWERSERPERQQ